MAFLPQNSINKLYLYTGYCAYQIDKAGDALWDVYLAYPADPEGVQGGLADAATRLRNAAGYLSGTGMQDIRYWVNNCFQWVHDNLDSEGVEYELSWEKIITAYLDADDNFRSAWQLLTDAYQASMYDKPFDLEYHKTWIARFKEWR